MMFARYRVAFALLIMVSACAVLFAAGWYHRDQSAAREIAELKAQHASAQMLASQLLQREEAKHRATEQALIQTIEEKANAERQAKKDRAAAAASARAAAVSLRAAARAATDAIVAAAAAAADPPAAERSHTATGPGLVLADVLGSCGERVAELAREADESRARGQLCEASYNAARSALKVTSRD